MTRKRKSKNDLSKTFKNLGAKKKRVILPMAPRMNSRLTIHEGKKILRNEELIYRSNPKLSEIKKASTKILIVFHIP
ncbi:MAG: hypothetical protein HYT69_00500 [Candidatus Zambryskibacteria bacterium]|nr:hypothetical protein [Candidatus Zambryskibacteria bacterium]